MSQHIEKPGILRIVYSGIFKDIQPCAGILRDIKAYEKYLGIIEAYGAIISHIRNLAWVFIQAVLLWSFLNKN